MFTPDTTRELQDAVRRGTAKTSEQWLCVMIDECDTWMILARMMMADQRSCGGQQLMSVQRSLQIPEPARGRAGSKEGVVVTVRDMDLRRSLKTSNVQLRHRSRSSMVEQSSAEERSTIRFPAAPSFRVQQVYPDIRESKAREHAEARQAAIIRVRVHNRRFAKKD